VASLTLLTIGQSPRPDLEAELRLTLGDVAIETVGALDGLSDEEVAAHPPMSDADAFHTRLGGERDVIVSKAAVTQRLAGLISDSTDDLIVVGCTGRFVGLPRRANVLYPSEVLAHAVDAVLPSPCRLGVLVPLAEQVAPFTDQWSSEGRLATAVTLTPGTDPADACDSLISVGVDAVLLDCFGYDTDLVETVRERTGRPVLSAVRITALLAGELLG